MRGNIYFLQKLEGGKALERRQARVVERQSAQALVAGQVHWGRQELLDALDVPVVKDQLCLTPAHDSFQKEAIVFFSSVKMSFTKRRSPF